MPRKSADDRKAEILTVTLRLADELGPDRLTTQAIADAIGISQPAIFRHFPSKTALWLGLAERISGMLSAEWQRLLAQEATPRDRLAALLHVQLRQIEANPAIPAILHSRELHAENAELRAAFVAVMGRFQALLVAELQRGRDLGLFRADLAPADGATLLISLVQGLALRWSLGRRGFSLVEEGGRLIELELDLMGAATGAETSKGGPQ
ncbi:TetR/AcrR family transcriptional regulator [Frigidibacter sp. ROC022]|uniref:TetR/AcrR family transcriptional regulator n=1 Tax=Frigidibacter sp. ROC022 TaxID=2971796 RepID=UPI00215A2852|nr:TetR family transcriptional regulator [Frigidibacter sp. ROC022]MCR8723024.1 TetR family transcriptional regulator [Frigidibacter sp. ROC022]